MDKTDKTEQVVEISKQVRQAPSASPFYSPEFAERLQSIEGSKADCCSPNFLERDFKAENLSPQLASQIFWESGSLQGKIPHGFYSIIADKSLKERFPDIPTPESLCKLGQDGAKAEAIIVDFEKDIKLSKLKEFALAAVKGLTSNFPLVIKKIAEVVSDFYGGTISEVSATKHFLGDISSITITSGIHLLGKIKHGLCQPRALLFKVLGDALGVESVLIQGLHVGDRAVLQTDPEKHISLIVVHNSTELLVDLLRSPGQLIPFSVKTLVLYHFSGAVESDSPDNDSCDSPLEPSSPLFPLLEKQHIESQGLEGPNQRPVKVEYAYPSSGPTSPNIRHRRGVYLDQNISISRSEPDIAKFFLHRTRRKAFGEVRTVNSSAEQSAEPMLVQRRRNFEGVRSFPSSPEHPILKVRSRSTLGGQRQQEELDSASASSSDQSPRHRTLARRASMNIHRSTTLLHDGGDDGRAIFDRKTKSKTESCDNRADQNDEADKASHIQLENTTTNIRSKMVLTHDEELKQDRKLDETIALERSNSSCRPLILKEKCKFLHSSIKQPNAEQSTIATMCKASLPYAEWNIDPSELRTGVRVGIGSFGEVYRGIWRGTDVAIKILLEQDLTTENMEDFYNEISVLSRLRHPNVILFLGACTKPPHLSLVTEFMHQGSLYHLMHTSGQGNKLSWRRRLKMLLDICRGMMCIQRMNIVHRDLKSANCLVDKHWRVKICDFGLSRIMVDSQIKDMKAAGTPEWMAPELLRNEPFTAKCDVFSFGVIMWELCTLKRPWNGLKPMKVVYEVGHEGARLEIPEGPIGKLISDCWAEDPHARPDYEEIFTRLHECEFSIS